MADLQEERLKRIQGCALICHETAAIAKKTLAVLRRAQDEHRAATAAELQARDAYQSAADEYLMGGLDG